MEKQSVALEILRSKCSDVETEEEAEITVQALEYFLQDLGHEFPGLSAPEINIFRKVAVIRDYFSDLYVDLVNPRIVSKSGKKISFNEVCSSFPEGTLNCLRYDKVVVENGLNKNLMEFEGMQSFLVQHEIEHLYGEVYYDKAIKLAVVRNGGEVLYRDRCPCGSKNRFISCCENK
jgi:peptide deformylase